MCLSLIGKIKKIQKDTALADFSGIQKEISLTLTPTAKTGDYVLVHAGFAIEIMKPKEAKEALKAIEETK
ncbi:MAG: HypC/HybG/HupF family hydrogenase formation chaperone [Elusimicrobiota bacterium]|jgi:hydrogenase expression/formation protein HypC|nr:HypC/HybG/HupF family hydrogenase formation chaperone [Elusimicrobiota bacterium]